ncbi:carbon catabolite repressor protein 4 homolog 5 isoform X3 [Cryptomeria japonica]|uniref:carbon catabolite repressor protein 4 homolog 5 isoform X3 n=1 Tax=Cryptomeria japonica TaxID=3369 RepID=UPI0027DA7AC7|nr:carbon catabolite repressor protein 4 homolog 5 isoform X3 [Cryptomeria japonica]
MNKKASMYSPLHHYMVLEPMSPLPPRSNFTDNAKNYYQNCERMHANVGSSVFRESSSMTATSATTSFVAHKSVKCQKVRSHSSQHESSEIKNITAAEPSLSSRKHKARSREGSYRKWFHSKLHSPEAFQDKFLLVSYNILGDENATHHSDLYHHIPSHLMNWSSRRRLICQELDMWKPNVICFQEVDHFDELTQDFSKKGYSGIFKDKQEMVVQFFGKMMYLGFCKDIVLSLRSMTFVTMSLSFVSLSLLQEYNCIKRRVIVGNIHVLFNPKRGDIKLGQVRILLEKARELSKKWDRAPIVIAGDFNSTPQSALYQFLASSKLDLLAHNRREISGQIENVPDSDTATLKQTTFKPIRYNWYEDELKAATGNSSCTRLKHPLKLFSAYACVQGRQGNSRIRDEYGEPLATTYHSKFLGTVDYIWFSEGLTPLRVLDTLPLDVLRKTPGLPTHKWGSDHLSLACEFAFSEDKRGDNRSR